MGLVHLLALVRGGGKTTITVFNDKPETATQLQNLAKDYQNSHKNVQIDISTVGGTQDGNAALKSMFASSNNGPTLFMIAGLTYVNEYQKYLVDQTNSDLTKQAIKGTLAGATLNGKVYGAPTNVEGSGFIVNKALFKKAGIDPESIKSFSDFKTAVETLDAKKSELGIQSVFALDGKENWVPTHDAGYFINPEFNNDVAKAYNSRDFKFTYNQDFKNYIDLENKYNAQPYASLDYTTAVQNLFATGKVAIISQGNWVIPTLQTTAGADFAKNNIAIVPMFNSSSDSGKIMADAAWYWGVNKTASKDQQTSAQDFLKWMYTDPTAMKSITNDFQYIPAYKNFSADSISNPVSKKIFNYMNEGKTIPFIYNNYPTGWANNYFGAQVQAYTSGQKSWDDLTKDVVKTWNATPKN